MRYLLVLFIGMICGFIVSANIDHNNAYSEGYDDGWKHGVHHGELSTLGYANEIIKHDYMRRVQ